MWMVTYSIKMGNLQFNIPFYRAQSLAPLLFCIILGLMLSFHTVSAQSDFICGADVSSLTQIEDAGGVFYDADGAVIPDVLAYLEAQGVNYIRLRLWHTPADGLHNLNYNLALAKRIHALGMRFLLDFHYSDTWADPAHQTKPVAWSNLSFDDLREAVYQYTSDVMQAFIAQGTPPDMVQIGNEISGGMLWDDGRVNAAGGWSNLTELLNAGVDAVRQTAPDAKIMIHLDTGGNRETSQWFFDHIIHQVDFDIIGLSYYPWWQGEFANLRDNLTILAYRYNKPIIVVETAYPWTLEWIDDVHNMIGDGSQLLDDYPATPQGQTDFLLQLIQTVQSTPNQLGMGWMYWESANITTPKLSSYWENLAQFDFDGRALPSLTVYQQCKPN